MPRVIERWFDIEDSCTLTVQEVLAVRNVVFSFEYQDRFIMENGEDLDVMGRVFEPCLNGTTYYSIDVSPSFGEQIDKWFARLPGSGWRSSELESCVEKNIDGLVVGLQVTHADDRVRIASAGQPGVKDPCANGVDYYHGDLED